MAYPPPNPGYPPPYQAPYPAPPVAGQHQPAAGARGVPPQYPGYPPAGYPHQPPPPPPGVGLYQPPAVLPQVIIFQFTVVEKSFQPILVSIGLPQSPGSPASPSPPPTPLTPSHSHWRGAYGGETWQTQAQERTQSEKNEIEVQTQERFGGQIQEGEETQIETQGALKQQQQ